MEAAGFQPLDWVVFAAYLGAVIFIGASFSKRQRSTDEYFTAGRRVHWLPVPLSVVASLFSGISFIGHPARVYQYNCAMACWPFVVLAVTPVLILVQATPLYFHRPEGPKSTYRSEPISTTASASAVLARFQAPS